MLQRTMAIVLPERNRDGYTDAAGQDANRHSFLFLKSRRLRHGKEAGCGRSGAEECQTATEPRAIMSLVIGPPGAEECQTVTEPRVRRRRSG